MYTSNQNENPLIKRWLEEEEDDGFEVLEDELHV